MTKETDVKVLKNLRNDLAKEKEINIELEKVEYEKEQNQNISECKKIRKNYSKNR